MELGEAIAVLSRREHYLTCTITARNYRGEPVDHLIRELQALMHALECMEMILSRDGLSRIA